MLRNTNAKNNLTILTAREPIILLADSNANAENVQQTATINAANSPKCE